MKTQTYLLLLLWMTTLMAEGKPAANAFAQSTQPAQGETTQSPAKNPGESIFHEHCARCHGPDGRSQTFIGKKWNIPDLHSDDVQKLKIEERIEIITHGKKRMPAHEKKLSAEEIRLVEGYVREFANNDGNKETK
jgi:mono/diheme cytochrome c family protein